MIFGKDRIVAIWEDQVHKAQTRHFNRSSNRRFSGKDVQIGIIDIYGDLPNKFQQDAFLPAGKTLKFPADDAKFDYRLADPGTETVIAVCNAQGKDVDGIKHDFKSRAFTPVGNYRELIADVATRRIQIAEKESGNTAKAQAVAEAKSLYADGHQTSGKIAYKKCAAAEFDVCTFFDERGA